jgi:hypothetical protein
MLGAEVCGLTRQRWATLVAASFDFTSSFIIHPSVFHYAGQRLVSLIGQMLA